MKSKILNIFLSVALAFALAFFTFNAYAAGGTKVGDTNGDGVIDLNDVNHLSKYIAGWGVELGSSSPAETVKNADFSNSNELNIWKTLPNKNSVHILMWRPYHKTEQELINKYEAMTGVDIITTVTSEQQYPTKMISMISEGNSPDIVRFSSGSFPRLTTQCLTPLNDNEFDLNANCWSKTSMDAYKINGRYFGVSMPLSWLCDDQHYVTYYFPQFLMNCGVTAMPYELYCQGKWNWETQTNIINKVNECGYMGLSLQSYDLYMHSAGSDFVLYDGSQFKNNMGTIYETDIITKAWQEFAALKIKNKVTSWDLNYFKQGKVGLFTAITYGLYNECDWFTNEFIENVRAVPVAGPKGGDAYTPVEPGCWGVPKKAKNPSGAAYFLRYFLDISNYNSAATFYNTQLRTVFQAVTSPNAKKSVLYGAGVIEYTEDGAYSMLINHLAVTSSSNMHMVMNSRKNYVNLSISRANEALENIS